MAQGSRCLSPREPGSSSGQLQLFSIERISCVLTRAHLSTGESGLETVKT